MSIQELIRESLRGLRFGSLLVIVQGGVVVLIWPTGETIT